MWKYEKLMCKCEDVQIANSLDWSLHRISHLHLHISHFLSLIHGRKNFCSSWWCGNIFSFSGFISKQENMNYNPSLFLRISKAGILLALHVRGCKLLQEIQPAIQQLKLGYKIRIGDTVGKRDFTLENWPGTCKRFSTNAGWSVHQSDFMRQGRLWLIRILINWILRFQKNPKWIIGFSDITFIHCHLNRILTLLPFIKMCNSFPTIGQKLNRADDSILSIRKALSGESLKYDIIPDIATGPALLRAF